MTTSSRRVPCLGFISPRSATLLLALFGFLAHVQQFNYLSVLHDSFPHVPHLRSLPAGIQPLSPSATVGGIDRATYSQAGAHVVLDSEAGDSAGNSTRAALWKEAAAVKPVRWFNLLPAKFQQGAVTGLSGGSSSSSSNAFMEQDWKARQRDQEEDRKSWEAARTLTKVIRLYVLLCALTCLCGIAGVVRSHLLCTRIFVLSSSIDLFLCALSFISLGIIVTYPNIRGLICEELSSTSAVIMDIDNPSGHDIRSPPGPVSLLGRAASTFWKRALDDTSSQTSDSLPATYWWDSLRDSLLDNENCDDVLESVLIPLGLVVCLVYLALRIHFLIVIRSYYISLLREQMVYHLSSGAVPSERKYSTSSSSSTASNSDYSSCLGPSSKPTRIEIKVLNEKLA